jgi:uncharacterized membrane protein YfcA
LPYRRRGVRPTETMGRAMGELHAVDLILFVLATFAAAFVAGLAGFAFGIVAAAVWLHFLPPAQTAALIVAFGLIVQGWAVWKLRKAVKLARLAPFLLGGAIGVPIGGEILRWASPASLRLGIGAVLVAFSLYSLIRPKLPSASGAGRLADGVVGVVNGALGGATGLAGIVATVWCSLRDWPPAEQRAVFQPAGVSVFLMTALWLGGTGVIGRTTIGLFLIGLPALALGTWAGLKLFGRLDETGFRRVVYALLLASGISLLVLGR